MERAALEEFIRRVRGLHRRGTLDAAALEAMDAFEVEGIEYLLLKGPALEQLLYTRGRRRAYSDVDLLVAPDDLPSAKLVLADLGYTNVTAEWGVEDVGGSVHADTWARRNQQIGPLMVDLHSRLAGVEAPPQVAWEALSARRTSIEVDGRRSPVLNEEGLALHLATHAAQHGPDEPKALGDLAYGLEHWPSQVWQGAAGLAGELQASAAFAAGLRLLPAGARLAQQLELPAPDALEWEFLNRGARPRGTFHLKGFAEARTLSERATVLRRSLLPKREWITTQYPWAAAGGTKLAAARVLHILRTPLWAARAWRFRRLAGRSKP
jgi:hypothetical protein